MFRRLVTVALALCLPACPSKRDPAPSGDLEALKKRASEFATSLVKMRKAAEAAKDPAEAKCPDDVLRSRLKGGEGRLLSASSEHLTRYAGSGITAESADRERWAFLTSETLRKIPTAAELDSVDRATDVVFRIEEIKKSRPYVAVIRLSERVPPRVDGPKFHAGSAVGWLFVFELSSSKLVCQAPFAAQSSELVAGHQTANIDRAIWRDFQSQVRRQLDLSLKRITRRLTLEP